MEPFIGQIQAFGFDFAPRGWAKCDGQLLEISKYTSLFALIGTYYGGDGRIHFALPDLRGRVSIHQGQVSGSNYHIGDKAGTETVILKEAEVPKHTHTVRCTQTLGNSPVAVGALPATELAEGHDVWSTAPADANMNPAMLTEIGGGQAHNNMQPSLVLNWCIALEGTFPSRD